MERNLWQIWYQGFENMTDIQYRENSRMWKFLNPTWKYECVDNEFLRKTAYEISTEVGRYYDACQVMHQRIDVGKVILLYRYGGMYVDCDTIPLKSIEASKEVKDFIDQTKPIIGLSAPAVPVVSVSINNGILMCNRGNAVMLEFLSWLIVNKFPPKTFINDTYIVAETTGPKVFTEFFTPRIGNYNNINIKVFDNIFFEPCSFGSCDLQPETVCLHTVSFSWMPPYVRNWYEYIVQHHRINTIRTAMCISCLALLIILFLKR
jgi:hypothetical protein